MSAGRLVLVIEDDPNVRESVVAFLEDCRYRVVEAEDGEAGIRAFRQHHPDLVLCDLRMPVLDGFAVLAVASAEAPEIPFVVVSGTGDLRDAVRVIKMGAWDYVTKPIHDMGVLEHALAKAFERVDLRLQNERYRRYLEDVNRELSVRLVQLQDDEAAGRRVQFQLLPPQDRVLGPLHFHHHLLPSMYLSGDFVDHFPLSGDEAAFYVVDVSGHGVSSAFVTVLVRSWIHQLKDIHLREEGGLLSQPEAVLAHLNDRLLDQRLDKYLTMLYGVIDSATHTLRFANGGQLPMPLLHDGRSARYLETRGTAVGLFPHARFSQVEVPLPPDFTLLVVSDGILEAMPPAETQAREAALLELLQDDPSFEVLDRALGLAHRDALPDDITCLTIRGSFAL